MRLSGGRTFQAGGTASAKHPSRSIIGKFEELQEVSTMWLEQNSRR